MPEKNKNKKNNVVSKLMGLDKDGKGVKKRKITDKERYSFKSFFYLYKNQFWNLIVLNLMFMLMISPVICGILLYFGVFATRAPTPSNILFAPVYGAHLCSPNPATSNLLGIFGTQSTILIGNSVTSALFYITLLVFLTFGMANVGMTYILRAYVRSDYVFLWHDFFRAIKKNFVSSIIVGICDLAVIILLVFSMFYYYTAPGDFSYTILFFIMFAMTFIYFLMRFYIYILLITFKLPPLKLIKNAFILALLGIKRNIMAVFGIIVFLTVFLALFMFPAMAGLGMTLPIFLLISNAGFMACFAAYPNVKKYMIDPYYAEHPEKGGGDNLEDKLAIEDEPVFIDRG